MSYSYFSYPPDSKSAARGPRDRYSARRLTRSRSPLFRPAGDRLFRISRKSRLLTARPRHRINRSNLLDDFLLARRLAPTPTRHFSIRPVCRKISPIMTFSLPSCPLFFCYRLPNIRECHHSIRHRMSAALRATATTILTATRSGERTDSSRTGASVQAFVQTNLFRSGKTLFRSGRHLHSYRSSGNAIFQKQEYRADINENLTGMTRNERIRFTPTQRISISRARIHRPGHSGSSNH